MQNERANFEVVYKKELYDITTFLRNHPGGINYLEPYKRKDVSKQMQNTKHSKAALYLFQEYKKCGNRKMSDSSHQEEEEEDLEVRNIILMALTKNQKVRVLTSMIISCPFCTGKFKFTLFSGWKMYR